MSDPQTELTHVVSEGGIAAKHEPIVEPVVLVGSSTGSEHNTIRAAIIPVACWRVEDLRFEFDSSFITPGIKTELKHLAQLVKDHPPTSKSDGKPGCPLSVFGHADPTGNDDYNKQLSGRRAIAIYALLTRDTNLWEKLFSQPFGNDKWGSKSLETMLDTVSPAPAGKNNQEQAIQHEHNAGKRKELFGQYMEKLCGPDLKLKTEDFLGHGDDAGGKGDFQGCSEFNPVLIFSQKDQTQFEQDKDKTARNNANEPNRRVMVLIFRKGTRVDPSKWPCPRVNEGEAGCRKRFFSDGEKRRSTRLPDKPRKFEETLNTFACRFYDRICNNSPCERVRPIDRTLCHLDLALLFEHDDVAIANLPFKVHLDDRVETGITDGSGRLLIDLIPPDDYLLEIASAKMFVTAFSRQESTRILSVVGALNPATG
jgi:hypothetical protein